MSAPLSGTHVQEECLEVGMKWEGANGAFWAPAQNLGLLGTFWASTSTATKRDLGVVINHR